MREQDMIAEEAVRENIEKDKRHQEHAYTYFLQLSKDLDNYLILIITGAILLSINFIQDIIPNPNESTLNWLLYGWIILDVALVLVLGSYFWSIKKLKITIKGGDNKKHIFDFSTHLSAVCMIIGIACLITFSMKNIQYQSINNKTSNIKDNLKVQSIIKTTERAAVYELPSFESNIINEFDGDVFGNVIYSSSGWYLIQINDFEGWVEETHLVKVINR